MSDMQVEVAVQLQDNMSKPAAKALDEVAKSADKVHQSGRQRGPDGRFLKQMAADGTEAARSMDAVGRETQQLQQQLKGAERSGSALRRTLSGVRDAGRDAAKHMAQMGKGLAAAGRNVQAMGGGVMAAGYVAKAALEKPVDREKTLLDAANIAYGGSDATGAIKLDQSVRKANKYGGGTYESAFSTQRALFASSFDATATDALLPHIQRTATATDSKGEDLAQTVAAGVKSGQFTKEQAPLILGMMAKSGADGSFEVKDMGDALPGIFTNTPDMKGVKGTAYHLANLQVMRDASGSSAEARTLYENVSAFRTSPEAIKNLKNNHVNVAKAMDDAAAKGEDVTFAFADAIQQGVVEKDKKYKQLKGAWEKAQGEEKAALERRMSVRQGLLFGKIIGDKQARQGAIALVNNKERRTQLISNAENNPMAVVDEQFNRIQTSTWATMTDAANTKDNAVYDTFLKNKGTIDTGISSASNFFQQNPVLATTTAGAATLGGMATAGGTVWGGMKLLQGAKPAADAGTAVTSAGGGLAGTAAKVASKAALPLAMGGAAYEIYSTENDATTSREQKNIANMQTYGGFGGMLAGAAMGGAAGSVVPVLGNGIGAILGGLFGYFAGGQAGKGVGEMAWGESGEVAPQQAPVVKNEFTFLLDSHEIAATVIEKAEQKQSRESLRQ